MSDTSTEINWNDATTRQFLTGSVARPAPGDPAQRAFYVDEETRDEHGIIPLLVTENVAGYRLMLGETPGGTWYWGQNLDEASRICDLVNAELFGLTRDESSAIVGSSMAAQDEDSENEWWNEDEA